LRRVQFPWRVTSILDLSIVIVFALFIKRFTGQRKKYLSHVAIVFIYMLGMYSLFTEDMSNLLLSSKEESVRELILSGFEPAEYRTKWLAHNYPALGYRELEDDLHQIPTASIIDGKGTITGLQELDNKLTVAINAESNIRMRFRRFYYAGWYLANSELIDERFAIELSPYYALIESTLPSGHYSVTLARHSIPEEILGAVISIVCIVICGLLLYQACLNQNNNDRN
jgi:hypothetical protein